jgi:hypothetical protein
MPLEKRRVAPQPYTFVPPPPPLGLSAFTGRKRKCLLIEKISLFIYKSRSFSKTSCSRSP